MTPDPEAPDQPIAGIGIAPVPTSINVGSVQIGDEPATIMEISTPIGVNAFFLNRDTALQLSSALKKAAQTGPQLVKPTLLVPR